MMTTIKEELRAWLRPVSPLTAFAKSILNEDKSGVVDDPSKAGKAVNIEDPLAGFDLDELPEDQRTKLLKLKEDFSKSLKDNTELEKRRKQAEDFARNQQGRADKATAVLSAHNIPLEGVRAPGQANSADAKHVKLVEKFTKDGLKPELAETYATMFESANALERESLMREMAPLVNAVGGLQAQNALTQAEQTFKHVFAIPEVAAQIRENVGVLVQQGNKVDEKTVEHITSMAWGAYTLRNPDALKGKENDVTNIPQFKPGLSQGNHKSSANTPTNGAPVATQPETIAILSQLDKHMRQGLPSTLKNIKK